MVVNVFALLNRGDFKIEDSNNSSNNNSSSSNNSGSRCNADLKNLVDNAQLIAAAFCSLHGKVLAFASSEDVVDNNSNNNSLLWRLKPSEIQEALNNQEDLVHHFLNEEEEERKDNTVISLCTEKFVVFQHDWNSVYAISHWRRHGLVLQRLPQCILVTVFAKPVFPQVAIPKIEKWCEKYRGCT